MSIHNSKPTLSQLSAPELPKCYFLKAVSQSFDFVVPGFERRYPPGDSKVLAPRQRDCKDWFNEFAARIDSAAGRHFLPVCRLSDGEFLLMLGPQPVDFRLSLRAKIKQRLGRFRERIMLGGGVGPYTSGHYHSGQFSATEWKKCRHELPALISDISQKGILAWHFTYARVPFQECYFPALQKWIDQHKILITDFNYYPFYFVYALLTGPKCSEIMRGRNLLVVNGAVGEKKERIIASLKNLGAKTVYWYPVSLKRSYFDQIDIKPFIGRVDLAIIGAGIGKLKIMPLLEALKVPCIDAGYVFESWANPENRFKRVWCASDEDWAAVGSDPLSSRI